MRMSDLIECKRDGGKLSTEQIGYIIKGYVEGRVPDYQMAAWAMAVFFQGMDAEETADLTMAMARSGDRIEWDHEDRVIVDKHSTGGVGDKTTLVVAPLVAACGVPVAKLSGRGLGHTGGTIDKLSSIPGFRVELSGEELRRQVADIGVVIAAQSASLAPADKKLYALRDVTACVDSIPLIASSVMSKKIASGAQGIVLDVKYGSGAFMQTRTRARRLADVMTELGERVGRSTQALLSPMEEPLGYAVGNSLEVEEAIEILQGGGARDLRDTCLNLAVSMLMVGKGAAHETEARNLALRALSGPQKAAWHKFQEMIAAQGGSLEALWQRVKQQRQRKPVCYGSPLSGKITRLEARGIGRAAVLLGAGRAAREDAVDWDAGIRLCKKCGDDVTKGETLLEMYMAQDMVQERMEAVWRILDEAVEVCDTTKSGG